MIDRLWAGWRSQYVSGATPEPSGQGSLFERILGSALGDDVTYVLWRGEHCAALLNAYPYTSGHLLVVPQRSVADLDQLHDDETTELWLGVRLGVKAVRAAYRPEGVNIGANLGLAAGAGVPDHLHMHVLPRWAGDTNFMTSLAEVRVMPEPLTVTWQRLRDAWPSSP